MKNLTNHTFSLTTISIGIALALLSNATLAKSLTEAATLLESAGDPNESSFMKKNGLKIGGWGNAGITYNATSPDNNFNGPVTFGDRSGEFQLNQLNLFVQRAVATEGSSWDFGGRFDVMFGTDSIFTQSYGAPTGHWDMNLLGHGNDKSRFYDLAMPQAYAEIYAPIGNGLNIKVGHFYTPIGYETVPAPDNFFYSHAYTMQFGEPFTHTGVLLNYTVDANWAVTGGALTGSQTGGWDGSFDKQLGNWGGLFGATWTSNNKGTSFNATGTFSETSETNNSAWAIYSLVFKHNITDKTHLMIQHDYGFADNAAIAGKDATWYGVNTHLTHDIKDNLTAGIRGEWFRDQDGVRVFAPARTAGALIGSSYYAVTAGVNWKPMNLKWLNLRPNVRYDWADGSRPFGNAKQDQFLFSTDFSINF